MTSLIPFTERPELVVGIVTRMGTDKAAVNKILESEFGKYGYQIKLISVTEALSQLGLAESVKESPIDDRISSYIDACNQARKDSGRNELLAFLALNHILGHRQDVSGDSNKPCDATVYVIHQFKRPEEIQFLREIYRERFIAIACHAPRDTRLRFLADKIIADHTGISNRARWTKRAEELIDRDEVEGLVENGQRVRDTIPLADLVLDASSEEKIQRQISRFLRLVFQDPKVSPSYDEYANNLAYQASLRSIDLSRQVGAAVVGQDGCIISLGSNEVPRARGGTYWESDKQPARDAFWGYDVNTIRKRGMVIDIVNRLKSAGQLSSTLQSLNEHELQDILLDEKNGTLSDASVLDSMEFGRAVHAEMNAITDAARKGRSIEGAKLYCTTFPCHNCAKHIVASGIDEVIYLEPYPKSSALELYPDSIDLDPEDRNTEKVLFRQYTGVTGRAFGVFRKSRAKATDGKIEKWAEGLANPVYAGLVNSYIENEKAAIAFIIEEMNDEMREKITEPN